MFHVTKARLTALLCGGLLCLSGCASSSKSGSGGGPVMQLSFASPEDASIALANLAATGDRTYGRSLFGPEVDELTSGDPEVDAYERERFFAAIMRRHQMQRNSDGTVDVLVGENQTPFPVPLVEHNGRWMFDTLAGVDRLTDIRVGFHELKTIEALRAIHVAQEEYRSADRDGDGIMEYAQQFRSTSGQRDGLYWATGPTEPNSPLGFYYVEGEVPRSVKLGYQGYFYKVLTAGTNSTGGSMTYLDDRGNLVNGYAVLAYPAVYGQTAIMTFLMGPDGVVYQRDLGIDGTPDVVRTITKYELSGDWQVTND